MGVFGDEGIGTDNTAGTDDRKYVSNFVLGENGTVTNMSIYGEMQGADTSFMKALIYSDNAGAPDVLKGTSDEVAMDGTLQWWDFPFSAPAVLAAGTYWLGWFHKTDVTNFVYYWDVAADRMEYNNDEYDNGPTDPFGASNTLAKLMSVHADYTVVGLASKRLLVGVGL